MRSSEARKSFETAVAKLRQFQADSRYQASLELSAALDSLEDLPDALVFLDDPRVLLINTHLRGYSWQRREQVLELLNLLEALSPRQRSALMSGLRELIEEKYRRAVRH